MDSNIKRDTVSSYKNKPSLNHKGFKFSAVTTDEVGKALLSINQTSIGYDGISVNYLSNAPSCVLKVITHIFNSSLKQGVFPETWKSALIKPIPKIKAPKSEKDFRPISLLCALSKALEKLVHDQMVAYLTQNKLLDRYQSGFRGGHSTTSALLNVCEDIRGAMDRKMMTILVLFDFSKAFDRVDHDILLSKLESLKVSGVSLSWFHSYLRSRKQCVFYKDGHSNWLELLMGVPQGSVLGPLLFSIYILGICDSLKLASYHLYADDLQIYLSFPLSSLSKSVEQLNVEIREILLWVECHGLSINPLKTKAMMIGYPRLLTKVELASIPSICVAGERLAYVDSVKNLGLVMNNRLTWGGQVTAISNKVISLVQRLNRYREELPFGVRKILVQSLVLPAFDYGSIVYHDLAVTLAVRLQRLQNSAVRFIFKVPRDVHITPYYARLEWMRLDRRRDVTALLTLHKILKFQTPQYLYDRFTYQSSVHGLSTRQINFLSIPKHRTTIMNKSYSVAACRLWNALPQDLRQTELSVGTFRSGLMSWFRVQNC